jgi:hypothetical protein
MKTELNERSDALISSLSTPFAVRNRVAALIPNRDVVVKVKSAANEVGRRLKLYDEGIGYGGASLSRVEMRHAARFRRKRSINSRFVLSRPCRGKAVG